MAENSQRKTKFLIAISLFIFLCGAGALSPLWVNPCVQTHLNEGEIEQTKTNPNWENLSLEQQAKVDRLYREEEIPCGAQDLPVSEKLQAARFQGMISNELEYMNQFILRFELVKVGNGYYYKAYTFFNIPLYRAFGGGSGYMEIDRWPFDDHPLSIADWD